VMARVHLVRVRHRHNPATVRLLPLIAIAMTAATLLRLLASDSVAGLWAAAMAWSLGLICLLVILVRER